MQSAQKREFLLSAAYYAALSAALYLFFRYLLWWLLPFLLAFGAARAMEPAVLFLRRTVHFKRGFSAALLTLFLLFLLGGLLSLLLSALFTEATTFLTQLPTLLDTLPEQISGLLTRLEEYCALCPDWLQELAAAQLQSLASGGGAALRTLAARLLATLGSLAGGIPRFVLSAATCVLAIFFFSASYPTLQRAAREKLPTAWRRRLHGARGSVSRSLAHWLRAQALLCLMTFAQLLLGLSLLGARFALLGAFLITLVDALPVFGTGTVLVPWAVLELLLGSAPRAAALLLLYLCTLTVRSVAEPKLMAACSGLPPIASLAAMYLGFRLFGVAGMVLFPFLLLLAMQARSAKSEGS